MRRNSLGEALLSRRPNWLTARIDDDLIMMNAADGYYLSLSGSGGRIWELLETPRNLEQLCQALCREYAAEPDAIVAEVVAFVERMQELKAIDVAAEHVE